ncbi:cell surface protein [uncultured Brachyspira sp.]|uniref:cell surface protein n=1 Tax=uncultured Brachyspira sp. TaxID=221953 RepID=UPI002614F7C7|nr:cell surface protein [uncultured Brachyspira sp.]
MKKVLLTAMAILTVASTTVFGMYGMDGDDWIGFLTDGNQLRARMDQLGFTLGNGTIKGTFGFRTDKGALGNIISGAVSGDKLTTTHYFTPTVSAGIGYTSDMFGIGVGYNFTYVDPHLYIHTPVLMFNALNNNLKIAVPIEIAITDDARPNDPFGDSMVDPNISKVKFTGIGFNNLELRYTTGIDAFNEVRFYASYRNTTHEAPVNGATQKLVSEALALQLRLYFLKTTVGDVTVNPFLKVQYSTALKGTRLDDFYMLDSYKYPAGQVVNGVYDGNVGIDGSKKQSDIYKSSPYQVTITPVLSLAASSDIVSLYFEPSLGYRISGNAITVEEANAGMKQKITHNLAWGAYAEMYVTPVEDLEWYFEMDINNNNTVASANGSTPPVYFETTTGITWYLPSFGGDTAAQ